MIRVPLDMIRANPFQSRLSYDQIDELADSIFSLADARPDTGGLLQVPPARIVVLSIDPEEPPRVIDPVDVEDGIAGALATPGAVVQLAAGHRRARAFEHLRSRGHCEYNTFPIEIQVLDDAQMADVAHAENAQRQDISEIERALLYQRAIAQLGLTQLQIGLRWGLSQSAIANTIRLLNLPEDVKTAVHRGELPARVAREALPLLEVPGVNVNVALFRHRTRGDFLTAAEMYESVRAIVKARTSNLSDAPWEPRDEWVPDDAHPEIVGPCASCPHRVSILRHPRCTRKACYDAKDLTYKRQVSGPNKAEELHAETVGWQVEATVKNWTRCHACDGSAGDPQLGTAHWYSAPQPDSNHARYHICPHCWTRAGLPEPETAAGPAPRPAGTVTPYTPYTPGQEEHPDPYRVDPAHRPDPDDGDEATDVTPARPAPVMRQIQPPRPPADVLTARILPGEDLTARRVLVAIGPEDKGPSPAHLRAGNFADLADLVTDLVAAYFPGNNGDERAEYPGTPAPGEPPQILMEV